MKHARQSHVADIGGLAGDFFHGIDPGVILADIQLRDGSSGLDAVHDILSHFHAPVIFVTAFPDRLLSGRRVDPTYLVTKPFDSEELRLTINKALLLHAPPAYALNA